MSIENWPKLVKETFETVGYIPKKGDTAFLIQFCNEEPHYRSGDTGTVNYIDDAGQIHVSWKGKGNLALLPGEDRFLIYPKGQMQHVYRF